MNIFRSRKTKHLIEESILLAMDSISEDIQKNYHKEDNKCRAEAIKMLAEAYDIVHRGKRGEC